MPRRWITEERRAFERQYNERRPEPGEVQRRIDNREISDRPRSRRARGDSRLYSCTSVAVAADPSLPLADEVDDRIAWWFGKRVYLGRKSLISKLFWLLATRAGYVRPRAEIIWELEHSGEAFHEQDESELHNAEIRLRKTLSRLRARLRESKIDDHILIVNETMLPSPPWNDTKGSTMIVRGTQPMIRRSA